MKQAIIDAIEKGIKREKASYTLYISLMKKAGNKNTEALFRGLALQEMKHEQLLREFEKSGDLLEAKERAYSQYIDMNLRLVEQLNPTISSSGLEQGFSLAIKREINAREYYEGLAGQFSDLAVKDVFLELAKEEESHERLLRKEYGRLFG